MSLFGDNPFRNPQPLPEKKMDPVDSKELKGKHADRTDKDIDNDGDVDSSDKFLHKKRKAITKNIKKDDDEAGNDDAIKEEEVDMEEDSGSGMSSFQGRSYQRQYGDNTGVNPHNHEAHAKAAYNSGMRSKSAIVKHVEKKTGEKIHPDVHKMIHNSKDMKEAADLDDKNVEKAMKHDCATHVTHEEHGAGECIPGMHTLVPANEEMEEWEATVSHYDVMFEGSDGKPFIVENVPVQELKIDKSESHMHKRKK